MTGKTVVVTGGTRGIGKEIARGLAQLDARLVLLGRNPERGSAVAAELREEAGGDVSFMPVDLSSVADVRRVGEELTSRFDRLDVLVNNAAVVRGERRTTIDGNEETVAVGHLAPFLLTELLLPTLRHSAPSRIVNVSSGVVRRAELDLTDIQSEREYTPLDAYARAKLLNLVWTFALARRLAETGVSVFAVDPGIADTGTHRDYPRPIGARAMTRLVWLLLGRRFTPARAARSAVRAAAAPELERRARLFLDRNGRPVDPPEPARRPTLQREVVQLTETLVGVEPSGWSTNRGPMPGSEVAAVVPSGHNPDAR